MKNNETSKLVGRTNLKLNSQTKSGRGIQKTSKKPSMTSTRLKVISGSGLSPSEVKMFPMSEPLKLKEVDKLKIQPHVSWNLSNLRL